MGCDIHIVVEMKHPDTPGKWIGIHACPTGYAERSPSDNSIGYTWWQLRNRNYLLFGALTNGAVREAADPEFPYTELRGYPDDCSDLSRYRSGIDHSPSWLKLSEAIPIFAKYQFNMVARKVRGMNTSWFEKYPIADAANWFGLDLEDPVVSDPADISWEYNVDNYRIVFGFDS
jgi:hypothetical protein